MKKLLFVFLFIISGILNGHGQCNCKNIYVWKFSDLSTKNTALEIDMANDFEEILTAKKYCVVLERRSYGTVLQHEQNEMRIQTIEDLKKAPVNNFLKAIKADIVVLASTAKESSDTSKRTVTVKFVDLGTKQILSSATISKPSSKLRGYDNLHQSLLELMDKMCGPDFDIMDINIQDTVKEASGILVDLDPLNITWKGRGHSEEVEVCLENEDNLKRTKKKKVSSSEGTLTFYNTRFEDYNEILSTRFPGEKNRIKVLFFSRGRDIITSREFELYVGIKLVLLGTDETHLEVVPMVDDRQVRAYAFETEIFLISHDNNIVADLVTKPASNNPSWDISMDMVKKTDWNRVGMIPNCIRDGVDSRMIRNSFYVDKQRHAQ